MNNLIDKVIFGGLYEVPEGQWDNDQSNRTCVPVVDKKGNLWMQDTYQIQRPSYNKSKGENNSTDAQINNMISYGDGEHYGCLYGAVNNYYYHNQTKITSENDLARYKLIADIRDYRPVEAGEDYRDYKDEDLIHGIKLFREHGYSWDYGDIGVVMIRKGAVKDSVSMLQKYTNDLHNDMRRPYSYRFYADKVLETLENVEDVEQNHTIILEAKYAIMIHEKLNEMAKEFEHFKENAKAELGLD